MISRRPLLLTGVLLQAILVPPGPGAHAQQGGFMLKQGETIVFLGDSITRMGSQPEGYVSLIQLFCGIHGYDVHVINAGIDGNRSNDMLARLDKDVLLHRPDCVSISCGVNDVQLREHGVSLPEYKKNMTEMVDRCLQAGARVLLLTATPIHEDLGSADNQKLRGYNAFLRQLARDEGILLCDLFQAFEEVYKEKSSLEKVLTIDGVHMNGRGNRLMAREILRALGASGQELSKAENRWELVNNP